MGSFEMLFLLGAITFSFIAIVNTNVCTLLEFGYSKPMLLNFSYARFERFGDAPTSLAQETNCNVGDTNSPLGDEQLQTVDLFTTVPSVLPNISHYDYSLEYLFGNVSYSISNCRIYRGFTLDLSKNGLHTLPDTLFHEFCVASMIVLNVSHNCLSSLPERMFTQNQLNLLVLDLSHNTLSRLPARVLPQSLQCLDLSFNGLSEVREDVFSHLVNMRWLDLSHNAILHVQHRALHGGMASLDWVSVAFNRLTALEPWPYNITTRISANVSHNAISSFTNNMGMVLDREIHGSGVDLTYNNVTTLNESQLRSFINNRPLNALQLALLFKLDLKHNPMVCDCHMYWVVAAAISDSLITHINEAKQLFTCMQPASLAGRPFGYLLEQPSLLVCNVTENCPEGCTCRDAPNDGGVTVICPPSQRVYTTLPRMLPELWVVALNLSGQGLESLGGGGELPDLSRVRVLDVSHNRLVRVLDSFLDAATSLQVLDLSHNRLTWLPEHLQRLSLGNVRVHGNPLACTCSLLWFGNWVKAVTDNATSTEETSLDVLKLQCSLQDGTKVAVHQPSRWGTDCGTNVTIHAAVGGLLGLLVVVVAMVACWRWRYLVRVFCSFISSRRCACRCVEKANPENPEIYNMANADKRYDVYISMDEDDAVARQWVKSCLLPLLEDKGRNSTRVYLPLRQELVGPCKAESRAEKICISDKVLVILSRAYVTNGWCRYEFDYACRHLQNHNPKNLVIVVMDSEPEVRRRIRNGINGVAEYDLGNYNKQRHEPTQRHSLVCGVDVGICRCDVTRLGDDDVQDNDGNQAERRAKDAALKLNGHIDANVDRDVEQIVLNVMPTEDGNGRLPQRQKQNDIIEHGDQHSQINKDFKNHETFYAQHARKGRKENIPKGAIRKTRRRKKKTKKQVVQKATKDLKGKELQTRQLLEELSSYTEGDKQEVLEPLRSFLLEGQYLVLSDFLFKYKLLFEITRIRKEVDFIDCD